MKNIIRLSTCCLLFGVISTLSVLISAQESTQEDAKAQSELAQKELEQKKTEFEAVKAALEKAESAAIEAAKRLNAEEELAPQDIEVPSRLSTVIPMPKPSPLYPHKPDRHWNVRLDVLAIMYREANLEVDYYLNDFLTVGIMGRVGPASDDNRYAVAGVRFNRYFKPHTHHGWFFSGQMYGIGEEACINITTNNSTLNEKENVYIKTQSKCGLRRYSVGMELLQSYQWIYENGFNINIGLGGKYVFDLDNGIKEAEEMGGSHIPSYRSGPWEQGIKPALEASIGWAF